MKIKTLMPEAAAGDSKSAAEIVNKRGYADRWHVSTRTCDNWIARGLPHAKISTRMIRIVVSEADSWMRAQFGQQRRKAAA
jgi:hypothetical protein